MDGVTQSYLSLERRTPAAVDWMEVTEVDVGTSVRKLYSCLGERVTAGIRVTGEMDSKEM